MDNPRKWLPHSVIFVHESGLYGAEMITGFAYDGKNMTYKKTSGANVVKHGEDFGKMRTYMEHPNIKMNWSKHSVHGLERLEQRGLSKQQIENFIKDGKVLSQNNGEKFAFITEDGVAILNKQGKFVTALGKNDFDKEMTDIIGKLFRK